MLGVVVISCTTQFKVWESHRKNHWHKEASRGKGHISEGSGEAAWYRCISWRASVVGTLQASPLIPTAEDVSSCCSHGAEGVQPYHLLGKIRTISRVRPGGRAIHCRTHQPWINKRGDSRNLLQCVLAVKVAGEDALWWGDGGEYLPGDPGLCQRMLPV